MNLFRPAPARHAGTQESGVLRFLRTSLTSSFRVSRRVGEREGALLTASTSAFARISLQSPLPVLAQLSLLGRLYDAFRNRFGGECLTHAPAKPKPQTSATSSDAPAVTREADRKIGNKKRQ